MKIITWLLIIVPILFIMSCGMSYESRSTSSSPSSKPAVIQTNQAAAPFITPSGGWYTNTAYLYLTFHSLTSNALFIWSTNNGASWNTGSNLWVTQNTTLQVKTAKSNFLDSDLISTEYVFMTTTEELGQEYELGTNFTDMTTNIIGILWQTNTILMSNFIVARVATNISNSLTNGLIYFAVTNLLYNTNYFSLTNILTNYFGSKVATNTFGMVFSGVPEGTFYMGAEYYLSPVYRVTLSNFYMSCYETTWRQWTNCYVWATNHGYSFDHTGLAGSWPLGNADNNPVTTISWYDIVKWCNALSEMEGKTPCYYLNVEQTDIYKSGNSNINNAMVNMKTNGYRLPTDAEWEYSYKAGTSTAFYWGGTTLDAALYACEYANSQNGMRSHEVGGLLPNNWGLHDMAGNVWEFNWDWLSAYHTEERVNPLGPISGTGRVVRGGAFDGGYEELSWITRRSYDPLLTTYEYGFRICFSGN